MHAHEWVVAVAQRFVTAPVLWFAVQLHRENRSEEAIRRERTTVQLCCTDTDQFEQNWLESAVADIPLHRSYGPLGMRVDAMDVQTLPSLRCHAERCYAGSSATPIAPSGGVGGLR